MSGQLPYPLFKAFKPNGDPGAGYRVYTYAANSATPQASYTTSALTVANANPVILDATGEAPIWLSDSLYKIVLHNELDAPVWSIDNISGAGGGGGGGVGPAGPAGPPGPTGPAGGTGSSGTGSQWIAVTGTPAYVSATSFIIPGDQTGVFAIGTRVKSSVTAGTAYGQVTGASYSGGQTTVTLLNTSGVLDSGLSTVATGIITSTNNALPILTKVGIVLGTKTAVVSGSDSALTIASAVGDALGEVTAAAPGSFTAKHAGNYWFDGNVVVNVASTATLVGDTFAVILKKNGAVALANFGIFSWPFATSNKAAVAVPCNGALVLAAGDVITFAVNIIYTGTAPTLGAPGALGVLRLN